MSVLWFNEPGDGWTYFKEEAVRLARGGHDVTVLCPRNGNDFKGPEKVKVYRCRSFHIVARGFIIEPFSYLAMLSKVIRAAPVPDVLYEDTSAAYPMSLPFKLFWKLKGKEVPMIVGMHGQLKEMTGRRFWQPIAEAFLHIVPRITYRFADAVLISGENCRERAISLGAPREKIQVMPFGLKEG